MKNFNDLYDLVELDEFEEVKDILNENASLALSKDEYGFTLLHASEGGYAVLLKTERLMVLQVSEKFHSFFVCMLQLVNKVDTLCV